jgi:hypothetical protein
VTTLGGGGSTGSERGYRDGPLSEALFDTPTGLACAASSPWLFVCDTGNHAIRRIHLVKCASVGNMERWHLFMCASDTFIWVSLALTVRDCFQNCTHHIQPAISYAMFSSHDLNHPHPTRAFGSDGRHFCRRLGVRSSRRNGRGGHL